MPAKVVQKFLNSGLLKNPPKFSNNDFGTPKKLTRLSNSFVLNHRLSTVSQSSTRDDESLWVKSWKPDIEPVIGQTVSEYIWDQVHKFDGGKFAFECGLTGRKYNFEQLYKLSRGFSAGLIKLGVQRGQVIGLVLPNIPEFPIALLGSFDAGCVVSTINPGYTAHEISRQLLNSGTQYVVTVEQFLPAVLKAQEACQGSLKQIIVVDQAAGEFSGKVPQGCLSFIELTKTDPKGFDFLRGTEIDTLTATALLPYSSGTTGPPKGVELTHKNLATNIKQHIQPDVGTAKFLDGHGNQERFLGLLPFFHVYGLHVFSLFGIYVGAHTLCLPRFDPVTFVQALKRHKPTTLHLVTPLISFICQSPEVGQAELESTHSVMAGAAPIGESLIVKVLEKAGKYIFFQEAWGMSELSPMTLMLNPSFKQTKIGSAGTPFPSTVCKIVDVKTGETLPANQRGELCIKGPQVMKGYLNNEKATAETIDKEGWLHTGDICYYDDDRCFYVVDRLKELIKVKGFQVAPSELEDLLREHEEVMDVAVIGVPDAEAGELPRAYIIRKSEKLTEESVHAFLKDKVISYKMLRGGIEFVSIIPKSPSGKLLRREILADYKMKHNIP